MCNTLRTNFIVEIVKRVTEKGIKLGKIQVQKLIYFLQENKIPLKYRYEIYHYGPYCFELAGNLDSLKSLNILAIIPNVTGYGYDISRGEHCEDFFGRDEEIINTYKENLDFIINNFVACSPSEIELKATIHYVYKVSKATGVSISKENITRITKKLKPMFADDIIFSSYDELSEIISLN